MLCSLNLLSRKGNHVHYLNVRCVGSVLSVQSSLYKWDFCLTFVLVYSQVSISVTPVSVIVSYMLRKFYSPTKTQYVGLVNVMC